MGIKIVREPSETPNINNTDDFVPFRYAYGNQDGYVIGKGNEVNIEQVDTKSVLIKSGRFVVQGVEVDIDANGIPVDFDDVPQNSDVFVTVYAEVSLAANSVNMQKVFDTVDFSVVDKGDDLTHITNGTANIEIAHIRLSNGGIVNVNKTIKAIEYTNNITVKNSENSKKVNNLEIKQDENGVLRIGNVIIPQKKLLWSGKTSIESTELGSLIYVCSLPELKYKDTVLEIVVTDRDYSENYIVKFFTRSANRPNDKGTNTTYVLGVFPNGSVGNATINCDILKIDFQSGVLKAYAQRFPGTMSKVETLQLYITKIYEIIE